MARPSTSRWSRSLLVALPLYLLVGSVAAASLLASPGRKRVAAPPLPPEKAVGMCPVDVEQGPGRVRLAAHQDAGEKREATEEPEPHPEAKNSEGCVSCHEGVEPSHESNPSAMSNFGCVGCHGGNGKEFKDKEKAHAVRPRFPEIWRRDRKPFSGNPERSYALLNQEDPRWIRFVNPGDLRIAHLTCGASGCHGAVKPVGTGDLVTKVRKSQMTHGGFLYGAALYNNGAFPLKDPHFGESYSPADLENPHDPHSMPQRIQGTFYDEEKETWRLPTPQERLNQGWLLFVDPLPRWNITQMGNILRVFERGGLKKGEVGNPNREEESGRPDVKLSDRGHGTLLRTDPVFLGLQKTRLLDPTLNFLGTNDQPGDFRSSGCSGCHNVYANDPDPFHSGPFAKYGNLGHSATADKAMQDAVKAKERAHPVKHGMTNAIPTSQCITCHMHPGTSMLSTYLGYTWWDNETDSEGMYPEKPYEHSAGKKDRIQRRNPEGSALRGKWGDVEWLVNELPKLNGSRKHTQFAQFNGHGWIFRAVYKRDRKGNLIDKDGKIIQPGAEAFKKNPAEPGGELSPGAAVHLRDIHLEKGMHCVDCHFSQDNHGDFKLYGEPRAAIEITCVDCHGTIEKRADLDPGDAPTTGPAGGKPLSRYAQMTVNGGLELRWEKKEDGTLIQRSAVTPGLEWEVPQVMDSITPGNKHYNERSRLAKTIQKDHKTWGKAAPPDKLAHSTENMACYTCHSAWTSSCFGCHLQMTANEKKPQLHNEGGHSRNWTSYNFQTLRDDLYMLGKEGSVAAPKGEDGKPKPRVVPVRSACAVLVSSQNQNREWLYYQQQTVSAEGFSGTAFSPYVPHTVRGKETKGCTDCHLSEKNDNNAWLANLMLQGSNSVNFIGHLAWVATGHGFQGIKVTERDEPAAVIGSYLHKQAYPDRYQRHLARGRKLKVAHDHHGHTLDLQHRGEYLYAAEGPRGLWIYDIANVENKGFSERIVSAPVSPLGQRFFVDTKYATAVAAPSTMALDPLRTKRPENEEGEIHPVYGYIYVTDKHEGLILVGAGTLLDGNPTNNFLTRALTWNPNGLLNGAHSIEIAGTHAYITCDRGLVIVNLDDPLKPKVAAEIGAPHLKHPRSATVQFRYAFVCDDEGLKVLDVTDPSNARVIPGATVALQAANHVYVSRTYAYVAAGKQGLAIIDVEQPERPRLEQLFDAGGQMNDARAVRIGMTNNSTYAYVADGRNGLRVVQLTSPDTTPGIYGYSPKPTPQLIATYKTSGPALAISEGLDRDRAVDESGNQLSVFGRRGARPLNAEEQRRMMYLNGGQGPLFKVSNEPPSAPQEPDPEPEPEAEAKESAFVPDASGWGWADTGLLLPLVGLFLFRSRRFVLTTETQRQGRSHEE